MQCEHEYLGWLIVIGLVVITWQLAYICKHIKK